MSASTKPSEETKDRSLAMMENNAVGDLGKTNVPSNVYLLVSHCFFTLVRYSLIVCSGVSVFTRALYFPPKLY